MHNWCTAREVYGVWFGEGEEYGVVVLGFDEPEARAGLHASALDGNEVGAGYVEAVVVEVEADEWNKRTECPLTRRDPEEVVLHGAEPGMNSEHG